MDVLRILLAEIGYRKLNFALSLFAVVVAAVLFVAGPMLLEGYSQATETELDGLHARVAESSVRLEAAEAQREAELRELEDQTRKLMRDMGFNLAILHADAQRRPFLLTGLPSVDMPQQFVDRLAADPSLKLVTHLVATLTGQIELAGEKVILVGYLPETPQAHKPLTKFAQKMQALKKKKKPMGYDIAPGTVQLGHGLGQGGLGQGRQPGQTIEVRGKQFTIATILPEKGSREDFTIAMHLSDAQALLGKPDTINEIKALECNCAESGLLAIRSQIRGILTDVQVFRDNSKADAREKQRQMVQQKHARIVQSHGEALAERRRALEETAGRRENIEALMTTFARVVTPLVVLACAIWMGLLALANVRQRRTEIGILRALGKGSAVIGWLFLGKAVLLGLAGAVIGCLLGIPAAGWLGTRVLDAPDGFLAHYLSHHYGVPLLAVLGAPLLAAAASCLPTLSALSQDPAVVLRDQ